MRYPDFLYVFIEESRMEGINAYKLHRKSGVGLDRRLSSDATSFRSLSKREVRYRIAVYHFSFDNDAIRYL